MGEVLARVRAAGIVAIARLDTADTALSVAEALLAGGIEVMEFTFTTRGAVQAIAEAVARFGDRALVGAGTVLDAETARTAILAGARFLVTPAVKPEVLATGRRYGVPVLCGALTPTEILAAWEAGADMVKVFPASAFGPRYLRDVRAPLPQVPLLPTGGVDLGNIGEYLRAGAVACGVGGNLVSGDPAAMAARARQYVAAVQAARTPG